MRFGRKKNEKKGRNVYSNEARGLVGKKFKKVNKYIYSNEEHLILPSLHT